MLTCSYNETILLTKSWQDSVWQASALEGLVVALVLQARAPPSTRFVVRLVSFAIGQIFMMMHHTGSHANSRSWHGFPSNRNPPARLLEIGRAHV